MSTFDAGFSSVVRSSLDDVFGESVTYTPVGGSPVVITARVTRRDAVTGEDEFNDRKTLRDLGLTVAIADVASPGRGDSVVVDGQEFKVESFNVDTNKGESHLLAVAVPDTEYAEPGTRASTR